MTQLSRFRKCDNAAINNVPKDTRKKHAISGFELSEKGYSNSYMMYIVSRKYTDNGMAKRREKEKRPTVHKTQYRQNKDRATRTPQNGANLQVPWKGKSNLLHKLHLS